MTTYPTQPTGDNSVDLTNIFASNSTNKIIMSTEEILEGYNNGGETATPLTSTPDGNKFNYFWYQVHNTLVWVVNYIKALFDNKLELSGGTMTGALALGSNKITSSYVPTADSDLVNKLYVDTAVSGGMWLGEPKFLTYPTIPTLPSGMEVVNADGRALSRTTYATYFALIGTTYGIGNGETTFNIPDLRGKYIVGWNGSGTLDSGRVFGSNQKRENHKFQNKFNYAARQARSLNITYTATTSGYVYIFGSDVNTRTGVRIDGIAYHLNGADGQGTYGGGVLYVNSGQTYRFYSGRGAELCYFIPEIQSTNNSSSTQTCIALYPVVRIK
jgi:hypothetical protein